MSSVSRTNGELLGLLSTQGDPSYKRVDGLLDAPGLSGELQVKKYARRRQPTNRVERDLLAFNNQPPEYLLMTLVMTYSVIYPATPRRKDHGVLRTAIGVFGEINGGVVATHIGIGTVMKKDRAALLEDRAFRHRLARSHELALPASVIEKAQGKDWNFRDTDLDVEQWDTLVDLVDTSDRAEASHS